LKHRIDAIYTETPFYGSRKITEQLCLDGFDGIVNLAEIDELITMNSRQKWGVSPNGLESTLSERS